MDIASVQDKKLKNAYWVIGLYKAFVSAVSFVASLGVLTKFMPAEALNENGLVLVRYCAWFCLFVSLVHLKAALNPTGWRYLLWVDTVFFALSALSPLLNLVVVGSLFWIWWPAAFFDLLVFFFCVRTLAVTKR